MCVVQCQVGVVLVVSCLLCAVCSLHAASQKPIITIHADEKTVTGVLHGTCEALGGRKRISWLFASFRDFDLPEHVPRTSARAHTDTQEHEKRPAGIRAINADVKKSQFGK